MHQRRRLFEVVLIRGVVDMELDFTQQCCDGVEETMWAPILTGWNGATYEKPGGGQPVCIFFSLS